MLDTTLYVLYHPYGNPLSDLPCRNHYVPLVTYEEHLALLPSKTSKFKKKSKKKRKKDMSVSELKKHRMEQLYEYLNSYEKGNTDCFLDRSFL